LLLYLYLFCCVVSVGSVCRVYVGMRFSALKRSVLCVEKSVCGGEDGRGLEKKKFIMALYKKNYYNYYYWLIKSKQKTKIKKPKRYMDVVVVSLIVVDI